MTIKTNKRGSSKPILFLAALEDLGPNQTLTSLTFSIFQILDSRKTALQVLSSRSKFKEYKHLKNFYLYNPT